MPVEKTGTVVTYADRSPLSMFFLHPWSAVVDIKTEVTNSKHTPKQTVQAQSSEQKLNIAGNPPPTRAVGRHHSSLLACLTCVPDFP